jgi:hypothetical protein
VFYVITFLISVVFGLLLRAIAVKRRANRIFWFVMGFAFGPFALPFVFFARREHDLENSLDKDDRLHMGARPL